MSTEMRNRTREKRVEKHLRILCNTRGYQCLKFVSPARSGVPDRAIITPCLTVFVELKSPGEEPSALQEATHERMRARGALVWVANSISSVEQLVTRLERLNQRLPTVQRLVADVEKTDQP